MDLFIIMRDICGIISQKIFHQNSCWMNLERNSGMASDFGCSLGCLGVQYYVNPMSGLTLAQCTHVGIINALMQNDGLVNTWMQEHNEM